MNSAAEVTRCCFKCLKIWNWLKKKVNNLNKSQTCNEANAIAIVPGVYRLLLENLHKMQDVNDM